MGKLFDVATSNGFIQADSETGQVLVCEIDPFSDWPEEHWPAVIDVAEYRRTYPGEDVTGGVDILDVGYWMRNGEYDEPEQDFRADYQRRLAGDVDWP